jgi:hypothetical protein
VAEGAVGFFLDHYVSARVARFTYGVYCNNRYDPSNPEHVRRKGKVYNDPSGTKFIPGGFLPHVTKVRTVWIGQVLTPVSLSCCIIRVPL